MIDSTPHRLARIGKWLDWIVPAFAIFCVTRFLIPLSSNFYVDWYNHQWAVGYFGEYIRQHGWVPSAFNTPQLVGMAGPVFYGSLGYALLGLPSALLSAGLVIRIAVLVLFALQYAWLLRALTRLSAQRAHAHAIAVLVTWAIYPLTNLYNRAALTEFFATGLLTCALSLALLLYLEITTGRAGARRYASLTCLCLALSAGTHPITALFGLPFFLFLSVSLWRRLGSDPATAPARRRDLVRALAPGTLASLACLSPWIYATARYSKHLAIRNALPWVAFETGSLDHWLTRFSPIPWDRRVQPGVPLEQVSTPFLDSQINLPLLIAVLVLAWFLGRGVRSPLKSIKSLRLPIALFVFFAWISLSPESYRYLPPVARMIQCAYRAVTYLNLAMLLAISRLFLDRLERVEAVRRGKALVLNSALTASLLLAFAGTLIKSGHIRAIRQSDASPRAVLTPAERQGWVRLPSQFYGAGDYATPGLFAPLSAPEAQGARHESFVVDAGDDFGSPRPLSLQSAQPTWVITNVQAFPWSRLELDGTSIADLDLRAAGATIAVLVPAGSHRLGTRFVPDPIWRGLRTLSLLTLLAWCVISLLFAYGPPDFFGSRKSNHEFQGTPPSDHA